MSAEPVPGQLCPVCGVPDPDHDWDVHDAQPATAGLYGAGALPDMLRRSSTRGGQTVRVLAVHSTEGIMRAADLRAWAGWTGSSHAAADAAGALLTPAHGFVPYHLASWTLRSGNPWSENIELCALARYTRAEWLARPQLLEACAQWLADRAVARGIPLQKLTTAQYRAGMWGVIDHDDHTDAYADGTHWDVGESFPWDVVIPRARALAAGPVPTPIPPEASTMRHVTLTNPRGDTPDQVQLLTIDPVGASAVLPKGQAHGWVQLQAFDPAGVPGTVCGRLDWLVATNVNPKLHKPYPPRDLRHRDTIGGEELPVGTNAVEVRVTGLRKGAAVSVHLDVIGHA